MRKPIFAMTVALGVFSTPALAGERTVTLAVDNMFCVACPHIVRESLAAVTGVVSVDVSYSDKAATVTFDDQKADVAALVKATTNAGYPSEPRS